MNVSCLVVNFKLTSWSLCFRSHLLFRHKSFMRVIPRLKMGSHRFVSLISFSVFDACFLCRRQVLVLFAFKNVFRSFLQRIKKETAHSLKLLPLSFLVSLLFRHFIQFFPWVQWREVYERPKGMTVHLFLALLPLDVHACFFMRFVRSECVQYFQVLFNKYNRFWITRHWCFTAVEDWIKEMKEAVVFTPDPLFSRVFHFSNFSSFFSSCIHRIILADENHGKQ